MPDFLTKEQQVLFYRALSFYFYFRSETGSIDAFPLAPEQEIFDTSYTPEYPDGTDTPLLIR